MKIFKLITITAFALSVLAGCTFIGNSFKYKTETKDFVENLLHGNYDKCASVIDMNAQTNTDTVRAQLVNFRKVIEDNFGDKLDYTFTGAEKSYFNYNTTPSTPPGATQILIQISNEKQFGIIKAIYDDHSNKIIDIHILDVKDNIPGMTIFWLFGIVALCIPAFNIYMIVKVRRSNIKTKWPKYLAIIFLNIPSIGYNALSGFFFKLFGLQLLFGISFEVMGYSNSYWEFGIPIGSLVVLYRLQKGLFKTKDINDAAGDDYIEPTFTEQQPDV